MGLLDRLKQFVVQDEVDGLLIYAPISGEIVKIEDVPDVVFAEKILGDGVAIRPTSKTIVAPIAGKITKMFDTNHAFVIESETLEIFVHFGIEMSTLKGLGFNCLRNEGDEVKLGDPIIEIDTQALSNDVKSLLTPVVVSNMDAITQITKLSGEVEAGVSPILIIKQ